MRLSAKQKRAAAELAARKRAEERLLPENNLFEKQLQFVTDPSREVIAVCSRRAGKSTGLAFKFCQKALQYPGAYLPFVTHSLESAKDIILPAFKQFDRELGLGLTYNEHKGRVRFPNGAEVMCVGVPSRGEIDRLRGIKFPFVAIDEAQKFPAHIIKPMLEEAIEPALMDYGIESQIALTGTPNAACAGYFYDRAHAKTGVSVHSWTYLDNPHIKDKEAFKKRLFTDRGWSEKHPSYLREYKGVWIRDEHGLVYKLNWGLNVIDESWDQWASRADDWQFTLGVDLGTRSASSFTLAAHSMEISKCIMVETRKFGGNKADRVGARVLSTAQVANIIEQYQRSYDVARVVVDPGAMGSWVQNELMANFALSTEAARKSQKNAHINFFNSDMQTGEILILRKSNGDLLEEMNYLQWDSDSMALNRMVEDRAFDNHSCDSALYAWRAGYHKNFDWELAAPKPGTDEYEKEREEAEVAAILRQEALSSTDVLELEQIEDFLGPALGLDE